jgi:hypothetical protein
MAVLAVLAFCIGIGLVFNAISDRAGTRIYRKTIQIAGVGSMVYAFLVATPMHDLWSESLWYSSLSPSSRCSTCWGDRAISFSYSPACSASPEPFGTPASTI